MHDKKKNRFFNSKKRWSKNINLRSRTKKESQQKVYKKSHGAAKRQETTVTQEEHHEKYTQSRLMSDNGTAEKHRVNNFGTTWLKLEKGKPQTWDHQSLVWSSTDYLEITDPHSCRFTVGHTTSFLIRVNIFNITLLWCILTALKYI